MIENMAGTTRLELATSAVTGQRSNQLNYVPNLEGTTQRKSCKQGVCKSLIQRAFFWALQTVAAVPANRPQKLARSCKIYTSTDAARRETEPKDSAKESQKSE